MLMTESLEIGEMIRTAMLDRYGEPNLAGRFQAFDTICSATQDRQDAVVALLREKPVDLVIVIGGYNSSNTANLARICAGRSRRFTSRIPIVCCRRRRSGTVRSVRSRGGVQRVAAAGGRCRSG
jgi:4-hydroxy-3-methylbut-2-enyl diphosphate reductase IspH